MEKRIENEEGSESQIRLQLRQLSTCLMPLTAVLIAGMVSGYSGVLLPQLKSPTSTSSDNSSINLIDTSEIRVSSTQEESWIAAAAVLLMAFGCWLAGFLMEKLGRRKSVILAFPTFLVGWLVVGMANSFSCLVIGRTICGLCAGFVGPIASVYISETTEPVLRSILLGAITSFLSFGIFLVHIIGTWTHWRSSAYLCMIFPILALLISPFSRESPSWLLGKGDMNGARNTWMYLRGRDSMDEYFLLENNKINETKNKTKKRPVYFSLKKALSSRYFLLPLSINCLFFFTTQWSGVNVVVFYSTDMMANVTGPENAYWGTIIIDLVRLIFCTLACFLMKVCKRRTLTVLSGYGTAFTLLFLSITLFFEIGRPWLTLVLLILYTLFLTLGLMPLPWMLCGELFPKRYRGFGSGLTSGFCFICFFVVIKIAPGMFELLQPYGTFAVYGAIVLTGTSILYFTLPETKDKTLLEIERSFDEKSRKTEVENIEIPMIEYNVPSKVRG